MQRSREKRIFVTKMHMMKTLSLIVILFTLWSSCNQNAATETGTADIGTSGEFATGEPDSLLVQVNNQFALDLYAELAKEPGNIFYSPFSISTAMAMTYAGARTV
jgi:serine protease inhibitor